MKKTHLFFVVTMILICAAQSFSQRGSNPKKILDELGRNANTFFILANRPSYDVSPYIADKKSFEIGIDASFGDSYGEVPVSFAYGISNKVQIAGGIGLFSKTYRFDGTMISGIGDANVSVAYKFQESSKLSHVFQFLVKIPTASKSEQLGTGHPDYHFGLAQGFNSGNFFYDLTVELGMLYRRDIPLLTRQSGFITQAIIDSMNRYYDYKFEPEMGFSFTPGFSFSEKVSSYVGIAFTRNTKLDYNTETGYFGLSVAPSKTTNFNLGASKSFEKGGGLIFSLGIGFTFR